MTQIQENKLPEGWIETTLEDVVLSANTGLDAIKRAPIVNENTGIRCFRIQDASQSKKYDNWGFTKVDDNNYNRFQLLKGDILIARTGNTVGVNYLVKEDIKSVFNNGLIRLRVNNKIDYRFLYNIISSDVFSRHIQSIAYGTSTQPNIQIQSLLNFTFKLPPLPEQQAIAKILSSFDLKIELLREQNETLEKIGQELFKEWFGKYKVGDELPEWWRVGKLGEVIENYDSKRIPIASDKREKGIYPYYGATGINDFVDDYIFDGIYTLLGEDGSVIKENGKPFTQYVWGKIWVNNHAHVLQGKNGFSTELIKIILDYTDITPFVNGAVQLKINQTNMNSIPLIIPTIEVLNEIDNLIQPIFEKIRINSEEIQTLSKTRDELLPKLMKGEVRVV